MKVIIKSRTELKNGEINIIDAEAPCKYCFKNGHWYIMYKENEETGLVDTDTVLKIEGNRVSIIRTGLCGSRMTVEGGCSESFSYATGAGTFTVNVEGIWVRSLLGEAGGIIEMKYKVGFEGTEDFDQYIDMKIEVKE